MLDIWEADGFTVQSLTAAVNKGSYTPGQIGATGIFDEGGVTTTRISIEYRDGSLALVEPSARGGPGETITDDKRNMIPFDVDHYERNDSVLADEVQNIRAFGSENVLETIEGRVNEKTARHARDLTMTLEHQRVGAIKGVVTAKSGTVLHDLYSRFGIAVPAPINFAVTTDTTDIVRVFQEEVMYPLEDELDEPYGGLHVFTGRDFHTAVYRHKSVMETLINHSGAIALRRDVPDVFELAGATFERYRTGRKATVGSGGNPYIAHDEARVVPRGVPDLFLTRFAPADYEETVNTVGLPFYARQWMKQNGKGRNLEVQMNAISLCTRPGVLRRLTMS